MSQIDLFKSIFGRKEKENVIYNTYTLFQDSTDGFASAKFSKNDIVKSSLKPILKAVGKLTVHHIRDKHKLVDSPSSSLAMLLKNPNQMMSMQILIEQLVCKGLLKGNGFLYIKRDPNNLREILGIYPLDLTSIELKEKNGDIFLQGYFLNGKQFTVPYSDVIHFRGADVSVGRFFADNPSQDLEKVLEVINTTDDGMIKQIKNSAIFKWIMKFNQSLKEDKLEEKSVKFNSKFMNVDSSTNGGVLAMDNTSELIQVKNENVFMPNEHQMEKAKQRIYSYYGVNDNIIQNKFDEDEWNAFYESVIEPIVKQLSEEFTKKIFTRTEQLHGNKIVFDSASLTFASMQTKLQLVSLVDRQALSPNEWRRILNMIPVEGGDEMLRRLDTAIAKDTNNIVKGGDENKIGEKKLSKNDNGSTE